MTELECFVAFEREHACFAGPSRSLAERLGWQRSPYPITPSMSGSPDIFRSQTASHQSEAVNSWPPPTA